MIGRVVLANFRSAFIRKYVPQMKTHLCSVKQIGDEDFLSTDVFGHKTKI